ncbi:Na/Pi cotransporter family protein [Roseovarius autotrophicus]|uniref:Na/Pi cotransporter family protein n=1 Tax=Roseovarius autotrophicus TaxID=2824121 RepID=UPI001B3695A9|nr:Na/Pi cotransporter family protein [Roseovarius autotrophicus]
MDSPNLTVFFLQIAGAAALLIWSVRLVRTGVERAFSAPLRLWLRRSGQSRMLAVLTGTGSAMALQSSTAVAVMVANFVATGAIPAAAGLAMLLGADLGSALVAKLLLVRQSWLVAALLLIGVVMFLRGHQRRVRQGGRILIGLALIFISLDLLRAATAPLIDSPGATAAMAYLARDTLTAFVIGAVFAWVVHSSVAAVLLFVTLVAQGVMPFAAAVALILGANLGGAVIALILTLAARAEARRVVLANLLLRGGGAGLALAALTAFQPPLGWLGASPAAQAIHLHILFNLGLVLLALPLVGLVDRAVKGLMGPEGAPSPLAHITALDPAALTNPDRALSCAAREVIRIGETVEAMLRPVPRFYEQWDEVAAEELLDSDKTVRKRHFDTKLYLAQLTRAGLDEERSQRAMDLSTIAANFEAASDTIATTMLGLARRLSQEGVQFSRPGWEEICDFHDRVLVNAQQSLNVMMTQHPDEARDLVAEKDTIRDIEQRLQRAHLGRLREGLTESIETSNIHQETLRALKQVNTAFTMVAYPILTETGELLSSRISHRA